MINHRYRGPGHARRHRGASRVPELTSAVVDRSPRRTHRSRLMCMCGGHLVTVAVLTQLLIITYGGLEGRRCSKSRGKGHLA